MKFYAVLCLGILAFANEASAMVQHSTKPLVVIFKGKTICDGCETPFVTLFQNRGYKIQFVKHGESTPGLLSQAATYVVPGGDDVTTLDDAWTKDDLKAIRAYLASGGRYYGSCLGAYWAAKATWAGLIAGFEALDVVPADVFEPSPDDLKSKLVLVNWEGQTREVFFQDGPGFKITDPSRVLKVYATYETYPYVAAFLSVYGKGKVAAVGPHPEATQDWYDEDHISAPSRPTSDLVNEVIDDLLN